MSGRKKLTILGIGGYLLAAVAGSFAGAGAFTFYYAEGYSYMLDDPAACKNCHIMREQYDSWTKSSHHAVATCNDCHTPHDFFGKWFTKAENGYFHSKAFTLQNFHEPIQIRPINQRVLQNNCLHCHGEMVSHIAAHHHKDFHLRSCVRCHESVGHGAWR